MIGYLGSQSAEALAPILPAFRDGLKDAGYIEGRNVSIEFAWAAGQYDKLPALAENLVSRQVAVIVASGGAVAPLAAKAATSTIPIVFAIGDDPVQYGLVDSFNHPGGNITGVTLFMATLTPKRLELLSEVAPAAALAILINPRNPNAESEAKNAQAAARQLGRELRVLTASSESEIDAAFTSIAQQPGSAAMIATDPYFFVQRGSDRRTQCPLRPAGGLLPPRVCGSRRSDQLRRHGHRGELHRRAIHRPNSLRREAGRPADPAARQDRTRRQSKDRQGARPYRAAIDPRPRRRGHRLTRGGPEATPAPMQHDLS